MGETVVASDDDDSLLVMPDVESVLQDSAESREQLLEKELAGMYYMTLRHSFGKQL